MMALIISIPQKVKADGTYYSVSSTTPISISTKLVDTSTKTYNFDFSYDDPEGEYPIPSGAQISFDALTYVIQAMHKGNVTLFASQGIAINWAITDTFSFLFNAAMMVGDTIDLVSITPHTIKYHVVSFDSEWVTYRFDYLGCYVDLTLTPAGDFTYTTENGRSEHVSNIRHTSLTEDLIGKAIQDQGDPTAQKINTPYIGTKWFNNLKPPFIEGKSLHFFYYDANVEHEVVISDFVECILYVYSWLNSYPDQNPAYACSAYNFSYANARNPSVIVTDNNITKTINTSTGWTNYNGIHGSIRSTTYQVGFSSSGPNINLPAFYLNRGNVNTNGFWVSNPNYIGIYNQNFVNGTGDLWLEAITYSDIPVQYRPEVPLDLPVPTDQIIVYPETELPEEPSGTPIQPDPFIPEDPIDVPGIPVNPIPPIYRPLPSIVSGNDDLWPSVVELENIEIDLGNYISGLDDYEFPDLSSITSSFSGAIVWVSAIMSTLFNGSDFSILFAVLSSFFIVAALLGLYKWWNHK